MKKPSFYETLRFWCFLGFVSFGGPAGQISISSTSESHIRGAYLISTSELELRAAITGVLPKNGHF